MKGSVKSLRWWYTSSPFNTSFAMTSGTTDCSATPLADSSPRSPNGKPDPGKHLMTHMSLNIQSSVAVERISQLEEDIGDCTCSQEYKHRSNTHRSNRDTIEKSPLMPDSSERSKDQSDAREDGGDDKGSFVPSCRCLDSLYGINFWLYKDYCVGGFEFCGHDRDGIEGV